MNTAAILLVAALLAAPFSGALGQPSAPRDNDASSSPRGDFLNN